MIDKTSIISKKAIIDATCVIGPYCIIGDDVILGRGCKLLNNVVIQESTIVGENNIFFPFSVIGSAPQDLSYRSEPTIVKIGNNNTFREYVTVHRGTVKQNGVTEIGDSNFFMAYSHIGHDSQIKDRIIIGTFSGISGHVVIDSDVVLSGKVAISQFVKIGKNAFISACSAVTRDVPPYTIAFGTNCPTHFRGVNIKGLKKNNVARNEIIKIINIYRSLRSGNRFLPGQFTTLNDVYGDDGIFIEIRLFFENSRLGLLR